MKVMLETLVLFSVRLTGTNGVSTNLFLALGDADGAATQLLLVQATDKFYILAYDNDNAFLY